MKKFKINIQFIALMLGISAALVSSAFTTKTVKHTDRAYQTYHMTLANPTLAQENDRNNWAQGPGEEPCEGTTSLCTISAPEGAGSKPDFSEVSGNVRDSELIQDKEFKD